ncbi:SusC/RagA family TonB-linked outer membrane protein [Chitinophaga sp. SYP-B3965]|uniref:TonB-dependent receptor n=1 Tax=Chitinophaga sp. SYP-B3965 TaxID=2663120 RepID=UPI001299A1C6|nr:TonB-dependent receptor [Chitinophaga sp. SYP-B3965]MRG47958.1 SusC/RagA family TonB-linked outer membrane protein [Chitinophaga sp. SYP-B3965]
MKFSAIIILFACMQVSAKGYAQSVTLSEKNVSMEKLFRYIEKQTGYVFFFDHKLIDKAAAISVDFKRTPLEKALELALKDQPLSYSIIGKNIVIKAKEAFSPYSPVKVLAQDTMLNINGRVTDEAGNALPGASVVVKGTTTGTATDANGFFKLRVARSTMIYVSYIGYKSQEMQVTSEQPMSLKLAEQVSSTDEIVVVGYGTVKKSDLTGSLSQVKSKDITAYPSTNVMQALNGRAAGVRVMQNGGSPGGGVSVRIRGANSILGGNEPLYVIDGFPYPGNPTFLQNSDIASMEILKDASSTAIYGSRGANGVVMITTKSGRRKDATSVDFEAGYTLQTVSKKMPLMNAQQYAMLYNEQAKNDGLAAYFSQTQIDSLGQNAGTDWQDLVLRTAPIYNASVTVNGGTEKTKFSLSGGAYLQDGIVKASDYKRYNIRGNIEHDISKVFSVSFNTILTRLNSARQNSSLGNRGSDLIAAMLMAPPSLTPYLPNGSYRRLNTAYPFISNVIINPLVPIDKQTDLIKGDRVFTNAAITIKPLKGLTIKISGGIDNLNDRVDKYSAIEPTTNSVGTATVETTQQTGLLNENVVTYQRDFNKHSFTIMGAFTYQDGTTTTLNGSGTGFLSDVTGTGNLGSAATPGIPGSGYSKGVLLSYLSRLNYSFNDKYLFTASIRRDGSSRYSKDNQWANFPSAALAWKASNEDFLKQSRVISDLKVRASYGLSGSTAISPYSTLNQLGTSNTIFGDALYVAFAPGTTLPGDLKWELTRQTDFGADIGFLNNKLRFTLDYYYKKTFNLLNTVRLPASTGYNTTLQNVGEIENKGFEFGLEAEILQQREVNWSMNANIAFNRNKVLKLYDGQDIPGVAFYTGSINDYVNLLREGQPLGVFYGYRETGYTATGNLQYEDISKDGAISAADKTFIGDPNPDFIYGLNSVTSWKGLELTIFIQGSQGNDIFNLNKAASLDLGMGLNLPREVYESHWTPENPNAKYPKITRTLAANLSTRFVEDGSYLRFKNIQIAYNLPAQKLGWKWIKSAQVYASGQNLITITKYSWYDPEVNVYGGANSFTQGIDYSIYPTSKSVTFGIRCGF